MIGEEVYLASFVGIAVAWEMSAHAIHKFREKHCLPKIHLPPKMGYVIAPLAHPAVWHGVEEYIVHLVVYSGHVIPGH